MGNEKRDYWNGLKYYVILFFCICLGFATPDGSKLFYKLLAMFGIEPGIELSDNSTLYVCNIILVILEIICVKKIFNFWRGFGEKFASYELIFRRLPAIIAVCVLLLGKNMENIYCGLLGFETGLKAVVYYPKNTSGVLQYNFTGSERTFSYNLIFRNCSADDVRFQVKLKYYTGIDIENYSECLIKDQNGSPMIFILPPKQKINFTGQFTDIIETEYSAGSASLSSSGIDIILYNEIEQYAPKTRY